jgi:hypothetical protein
MTGGVQNPSAAAASDAVNPVTGSYYAPCGPTNGAVTRPAAWMTFVPVILAKGATFDRMAVEFNGVAAAGSLIRLGIYAEDATPGRPGALILDAGTIAGDVSAGEKTIVINQALPAGVSWLAAAVQGGVTSPASDGFNGNGVLPYSPCNASGVLRWGWGWVAPGTGPAAGALPPNAQTLGLVVADTSFLVAIRST